MGFAVGMALLSSLEADIRTSDMAAAIFECRRPVTSSSIRNNTTELVDPENGGLAVGTALLSSLEAEI